VGITHFEQARSLEYELGHLRGRWTALGQAAGCVHVGIRRIQVPSGGWSTPVHEHGREEEIFYVLSGRGLSFQGGKTAEVRAADCIVYLPGKGAHSLHAVEDIDVLAFGPREYDESVGFPRLGMSLVGRRAAETAPGSIDGAPFQFVRESQLGPPELPSEPGPRPGTIVNLADVTPVRLERPLVVRTRRNLGREAGSVSTGLQHVEVEPGKDSAPAHCHSLEEEIFVILDGEGTLVLGDDETPVGPGHVVSRPAATGVAHKFRAGERTLTYLAYGTREPGDMCYYPHSNKISFRGLNLMARLEKLDYWDGED
jgi:uncharacterized cupin superfamily protein